MSNVVGLRGEPIPCGDPVPEVVTELEQWLERARSGDVVGIAIAASYADGASGSRWAGMLTRATVGHLFSLMSRITAKIEE